MADQTSYILANAPIDPLDFPNFRTLETSGGLSKLDTGSEGTFTISTQDNLATLNGFSSSGLVVYDPTDPAKFVARTLDAGTGVTITRPTGESGNPQISLNPSTSLQLVQAQANNGPIQTPRSLLNFVPGTGISVTAVDDGSNPGGARTNVTITATGGPIPPANATYVLETANGSLPDAFSLGTLTTGMVKVTSNGTTGTLSTAVANTDYQAANAKLTAISGMPANAGDLIVGEGSGVFGTLSPGASGTVLGSTGSSLGWVSPGSGGYNVVVAPTGELDIPMVSGTTYIANDTTQPTTFSLHGGISSPGNFTQIIGYGSGGWGLITNGDTVSITVGNQTYDGSVTGPAIQSILPTDSIAIYCVDSTHYVVTVLSGQVTLISDV